LWRKKTSNWQLNNKKVLRYRKKERKPPLLKKINVLLFISLLFAELLSMNWGKAFIVVGGKFFPIEREWQEPILYKKFNLQKLI
jgi:hypothetical protein